MTASLRDALLTPAAMYDDLVMRGLCGRVLCAFHRLQWPDDVRRFDVVGPTAPSPLTSDHCFARLVIESATGLRVPDHAGGPPMAGDEESPLRHYLAWLLEVCE